MISVSTSWLSPLRNSWIVSLFPWVYPAFQAYSSKVVIYSLMKGKHMVIFSNSFLAQYLWVESWNWVANSMRNWSHTAGTLSWAGFNPSIQIPISCAHMATLSPLRRVSIKVTFLIGELKPATSLFRWRYPLTSSMKLLAWSLSPVKIWGRLPIALTSFAVGMTPWGAVAGGPPPPLLPPPLPPPPLPLVGWPGRGALWCLRVAWRLAWIDCGVAAAPVVPVPVPPEELPVAAYTVVVVVPTIFDIPNNGESGLWAAAVFAVFPGWGVWTRDGTGVSLMATSVWVGSSRSSWSSSTSSSSSCSSSEGMSQWWMLGDGLNALGSPVSISRFTWCQTPLYRQTAKLLLLTFCSSLLTNKRMGYGRFPVSLVCSMTLVFGYPVNASFRVMSTPRSSSRCFPLLAILKNKVESNVTAMNYSRVQETQEDGSWVKHPVHWSLRYL